MAKVQDKTWDIKKVMQSLYKYEAEIRKGKSKEQLKQLSNFTVHGGEPLLLPFDDLRLLLQYSYKKYKSSGIQTSLLHMTGKHLELFKKFKTHIGISIDGHMAEMNKMRFPKEYDYGKIGTNLDNIFNNITNLIEDNVNVSVITVLRKCNSHPPYMIDFLYYLKSLGIQYVKLNPGTIYDKSQKDLEASCDDLWNVYTVVHRQKFKDMIISPIADIIEGMYGNIGNMTCTFRKCDPWSASADTTLMGDGSFGTCMHTGAAIDGIQALRGDKSTHERYEALRQIPQEDGGCKDCEYWFMCTGGCPGAGIDNDWRNKTRFCEGLKAFYKFIYYEIKNLTPNIHLTPDFYPDKPDKKIIQKSIDKGTYQKQYRLPKPRSKDQEWIGIDKGDGIIYQDSNNSEWLKKNPGWGK
jgi:uncharacterized protein